MGTQVKPQSTDVLSRDFWKQQAGNSKQQTKQIYTRWKAFAGNTSLHGIKYVFEKNLSIAGRVIWLFLLISSTSGFLYVFSLSVQNYLSKPIKTVISQVTPTDGLKFPAVTICNLNKFMKSKIDVADHDENFETLGLNISGCNETRSVRGNLTCGQALLCAHTWYGTALVNGCNETTQKNIIDAINRTDERLFNEEQFLTKYGHDIASMFVLYCHFMEKPCSDKDFVPTFTRDGLCFTFNSGHNGSVLYAMFEGPYLGLNIILDVQTNESTMSDFSEGLRIILHDQGTYVNRHSGFNVLPGTHASVAVMLRKHTRLRAPYRTNCQQTKLPGIGSYTKDGCIYQCFANMTLAHCGCRRIGLPEPNTAPICSFQDKDCVENSRKQTNITECPCNHACSELEFDAAVSYSRFPDNAIIKILQNLYGKKESKSYMRDNYVFLQVGFQHLAFENREDVPMYGFESLFGEVGGNLGLFLGCSLLTICEFLHFLWDAVMSRIRKRSLNINPELNNE